ncbi:MAG: carboxymuconolactone decarboxylase family protein [Lentimicrobiaceae bacterium]|jgi:AhpD family alkylhydroperoxidase|nr:carboxymuconolactone decarboxylase family protein [Lentimicrobiaceae bacterium]MDD4599166.1 carboxymuconolactone decarboxylase family protein [Lentimicrobiaceae bacterium]MDY0281639.1 carboxymuconolactone decarboxylase family protein [Salinivirgaceae bacterium]
MDYVKRNNRLNELAGQMGKEIPDVMSAFTRLHMAAIKDNALSKKVKELISLGIGITVRCDGCIAAHVNDALRAGASREEIMETIGVAILMGGGPSMVYGSEAMEALNQFQGKDN